MAPELLGGGQATFKADIYSTAATIYRMITGRHPIEAKRLNDWLVAVQSQQPPPAREIQPGIPEKVSAALARALDKNPERRPASMRDLRKDLGY
jgi:serine/threonine-protein kinase